jgi:hypothetical protein
MLAHIALLEIKLTHSLIVIDIFEVETNMFHVSFCYLCVLPSSFYSDVQHSNDAREPIIFSVQDSQLSRRASSINPTGRAYADYYRFFFCFGQVDFITFMQCLSLTSHQIQPGNPEQPAADSQRAANHLVAETWIEKK